ncbi:hypothetical protein HG536_0E05400 [Torulaspora globosa]|uniref:Uncharacterized protein n=1 Tax=Torulaspora globosa TaxID=48254 RepID=A0A7G3ZJE3_9SACH|nr:uncharacterized protein HG536_0E05400 [Torulaspora globosa]QLL33629.1 hypothetical protein HG536_0E05400 [Torulaspora globosa]
MQFEKIQRLLDWGGRFGVEIPSGVRFEFDEIEGIRCICTERIESPMLSIPSDLIIRKELLSLALPNITYKDADSNTYLKFLLAKLMYDCRDEQINELRGKFKPYLDCLPAVVESPLIWNPREQALLEGTNLGSSLRDKLHAIWREWYTAIQNCDIFDKTAIQKDLELYENYHGTSMEIIYESILKETVHRTPAVWYSFSAFLWSHLIFLSRAFPEYVLNSKCQKHHVMLLPIVDLLNHDYKCKVEWLGSAFKFSYKYLGSAEKGTQLYNNYGRKGNEELLSGYGFVLMDNPCSSVALRIKLTFDSISEILTSEPSIRLLTLEDYTTFAFDRRPGGNENPEGKNAEHIYREGVTYLICKNNEGSLQNMLSLFAYLNKVDQEDWKELASQFRGLQSLRLALDQKLRQIDVKCVETEPNLQYPIDHQRKQNAVTYKKEQISILKWALSLLKSKEKQWLSENKTALLTAKKVMKYDPRFLDEELPAMLGRSVDDYLASLSSHQFLALWISMKLFNRSFVAKYSWVEENYKNFISGKPNLAQICSDPEADSFHSALLEKSGARFSISVEDIRSVFQFLAGRTFTRLASRDQETILVRRLDKWSTLD